MWRHVFTTQSCVAATTCCSQQIRKNIVFLNCTYTFALSHWWRCVAGEPGIIEHAHTALDLLCVQAELPYLVDYDPASVLAVLC